MKSSILENESKKEKLQVNLAGQWPVYSGV